MGYKAVKNSLEDSDGNQILVMLPTHCSRKRLNEICKITANVLNNIERGNKQKEFDRQRAAEMCALLDSQYPFGILSEVSLE